MVSITIMGKPLPAPTREATVDPIVAEPAAMVMDDSTIVIRLRPSVVGASCPAA
jgi:hypothetical protein